MAFALSGSTITQTGTDTNLSGLASISGVTLLSLGGGKTIYNIANLKLVLSGTISWLSYLEVIVTGNAIPTRALTISGTVTVNGKKVINGVTIDTYDYGYISSATNLVNCCDNGTVSLDSGGTLELLGSSIEVGAVMNHRAGSTFRTRNGKITCRRDVPANSVRIRQSGTIDVDGLITEGISLDLFVVPTQLNNYSPRIVANLHGVELVSTPNAVLEGFNPSGSNVDFDNWNNDLLTLRNAVKGTDMKITNSNGVNSRTAISKQIDIRFIDLSNTNLAGVKIVMEDTDNGSRASVGGLPNGYDASNNIKYSLESGANGKTGITEIYTGFSRGGHVINSPNGQTLDRRGNSNNAGDDVFTFFACSYHHRIAQVNYVLNGAGVLEPVWTLFIDSLITEQNRSTVDAYTHQDTPAKAYDYGKSRLTTNYNREAFTYISRIVDTLDLGSKDLTIGEATTFDQSSSSIVLKAPLFKGDIKTTGAVVLDAIAEDKTIDGASSVKLTTLPTKLTLKNSTQGVLLEAAGTYDFSEFVFEGGTVNYTKLGNNNITIKTGGKNLVGGGETTGLTIDNSVPKRFFGMPTGLPHTATPILLEELANNGDPLSPRVYLEPFSDSATGEVTVSLKPNTKYDWKGDALGYERSNGDTFRRIDTATHIGDIEVSLTQILYPAGGAIYGNGNPAHLALMTLDVATVQARLGAIPVGEKVSFETGVDFIEIQLTNHAAMKLGLRQPSLNPTAKEIIWPDNSPLTISDIASNTRVVELDFVSKKVDGTLTLASPFNSAYGVRMPETIITATGGDVNLVSVNGTAINTLEDFNGNYRDNRIYYSDTDPNREAGRVVGVNGTKSKPCNDVDDAIALARELSYELVILDGNVTITGEISQLTISGGVSRLAGVRLTGECNLQGAHFKNLILTTSGSIVDNSPVITLSNVTKIGGTNWADAHVIASNSLVDRIAVKSGYFDHCKVQSVVADGKNQGSILSLRNCSDYVGMISITAENLIYAELIDCQSNLLLRDVNGVLRINGGTGHITIQDGSTGNLLLVGRNSGAITDHSNGGVTVTHTDERVGEATDLNPVLTAINALNNVSASQVRAEFNPDDFKADLTSLVNAIAQIPTTDSVADLTPVLSAITALNDVTPAQIRAAFNEADFKDKNTEAEIHDWLDNYTNKENWKANDIDLSSVVTPLRETRNRANYIARNTKPL